MKFVRIFIFIFISGIIFLSCSKEIQYKTLTFFFDGVPDTTVTVSKKDTLVAVASQPMENMVMKAPETNKVVHPPYRERACENCHSEGSLTLPQPQLCYQCHDDFATKYAYVHGPVGGGYCTACHHPHMGEKYLLLRKGHDLCLFCHDKEMVFKNEVHSDIGDTYCTECHNPHGGQEKYMFN